MSDNILFISPTMIKERSAIHGNIDEKFIFPEIKICQDMYILPILGSALYFKIQTIISDSTITTNPALSNYKNLLDKYIVDALMYYTIAQLGLTLSFQYWNKGVVIKQGDNTQIPSMADLVDIQNRNTNRAEFYSQRLRLFVMDQAGKGFLPEYMQPGNTIDTIYPGQRSFTNPIYLGDDTRDNPFCNKGGFTGEPYKP